MQVCRILPGEVELLQIHNVGHLLDTLGGDILGGIVGSHPLHPLPDGHDVQQVGLRDAQHHTALSGAFNEPLLLQPPQSLPDGGAADPQLLRQTQLRENLSSGVDSLNDIILQAFKNLIRQRCGFKLIHSLSPYYGLRKRPGASCSSFSSSS